MERSFSSIFYKFCEHYFHGKYSLINISNSLQCQVFERVKKASLRISHTEQIIPYEVGHIQGLKLSLVQFDYLDFLIM